MNFSCNIKSFKLEYVSIWCFVTKQCEHSEQEIRVTRFSFATKGAKYIQISQFCEHGLVQSAPDPLDRELRSEAERSWLQTWRSGLRPRLKHLFSATKVMPVAELQSLLAGHMTRGLKWWTKRHHKQDGFGTVPRQTWHMMQGKSALPRNTGSPCSHEQTYEASTIFL